jgi:hypothetical protein
MLRATSQRTDNLNDQKLKARPLCRSVPAGDELIGIQNIVGHPSVHQSIDEAAHPEDASAPLIQCTRFTVHSYCEVGH